MAKILFVDDNVNTLKLMETCANILGYEVISCSSAEDAIKIVEKDLPELVFVDYGLQDLDGTALIRKLRTTTTGAKIKIVMISAGFGRDDAYHAELAGADQYIEKPLSLEKLSTVFNECFNGHNKINKTAS
jgi:two-component system KDP operon response regulator KdpE